jgi:hypothetical protein
MGDGFGGILPATAIVILFFVIADNFVIKTNSKILILQGSGHKTVLPAALQCCFYCTTKITTTAAPAALGFHHKAIRGGVAQDSVTVTTPTGQP